MKLIAIFFALLSLTLSINPCCVEEKACEALSSQEPCADSPDEPEEAAQACSPFYACGGCIGFTIQPQFFAFPALIAAPAPPASFYQVTFPPPVRRLLLKPPRRG